MRVAEMRRCRTDSVAAVVLIMPVNLPINVTYTTRRSHPERDR